MITRKIKIAFMAILATIGMMFAVAAPADAYTIGAPGSAAEATAPSAFSMSGTAYVGAWVDDYPLPTGAAAVVGTKIDGQLFDKNDKLIATKSADTAADGTYSIAGNIIWAGYISAGGYVKITSVDGGQANAAGGSTRVINLALFDAKRVGGSTGTSALPFNIAF